MAEKIKGNIQLSRSVLKHVGPLEARADAGETVARLLSGGTETSGLPFGREMPAG